jgi:hypothetical protein
MHLVIGDAFHRSQGDIDVVDNQLENEKMRNRIYEYCDAGHAIMLDKLFFVCQKN